MEFCQLQINYLDWHFQKAKLKPEYEKQLHALRPWESIPGWAFRFVQSIPQVTMVLSGMSDMKQLQENVETWSKEEPLNDTEKKTLFSHRGVK